MVKLSPGAMTPAPARAMLKSLARTDLGEVSRGRADSLAVPRPDELVIGAVVAQPVIAVLQLTHRAQGDLQLSVAGVGDIAQGSSGDVRRGIDVGKEVPAELAGLVQTHPVLCVRRFGQSQGDLPELTLGVRQHSALEADLGPECAAADLPRDLYTLSPAAEQEQASRRGVRSALSDGESIGLHAEDQRLAAADEDIDRAVVLELGGHTHLLGDLAYQLVALVE